MDVKVMIKNNMKDHTNCIQNLPLDIIEKISFEVISCLKNGNKIIIVGNGGSAADAQHFAAELEGKYNIDRKPLPVMAITNLSTITAVGNDYGYDKVFERPVSAHCNKGDVVIGISTSGNSKNVINALISAKKKGAKTIAFTGESGGALKNHADIVFFAPSSSTPRIQECHEFAYHTISELVENGLFDGILKLG